MGGQNGMKAGCGDYLGGFGGEVFRLGAVIIADEKGRLAGNIWPQKIIDDRLGDEPDICAGEVVGDDAAPSVGSKRDLRLLNVGHKSGMSPESALFHRLQGQMREMNGQHGFCALVAV